MNPLQLFMCIFMFCIISVLVISVLRADLKEARREDRRDYWEGDD